MVDFKLLRPIGEKLMEAIEEGEIRGEDPQVVVERAVKRALVRLEETRLYVRFNGTGQMWNSYFKYYTTHISSDLKADFFEYLRGKKRVHQWLFWMELNNALAAEVGSKV